jgi:hypothetical protein
MSMNLTMASDMSGEQDNCTHWMGARADASCMYHVWHSKARLAAPSSMLLPSLNISIH